MRALISPLKNSITLTNKSTEPISVSAIGDAGEFIYSVVLHPGFTMIFTDDEYQAFYFGNGAVYRSDYDGMNVLAVYYSAQQHTITPI
jgi:hypothetical protein